jgi:hypothetical protein
MEETNEGDLVGPQNWVILRISRTVPNPDYLEEQDNQARYIEEGAAALRAQVEAAGTEWTAQMQIESVEALKAESEPESDPLFAQDLEAALCPKHAEYPQTRLGVAEWPDVDEDEEE